MRDQTHARQRYGSYTSVTRLVYSPTHMHTHTHTHTHRHTHTNLLGSAALILYPVMYVIRRIHTSDMTQTHTQGQESDMTYLYARHDPFISVI